MAKKTDTETTPTRDVKTMTFKEKIFDLQTTIRGVAKDSTNPHFHYKYISAQNVNETVKEKLEELRLIAQVETELEDSPIMDAKNETQDVVLVARTAITLHDVDSEGSMSFSGIGSGTDTSDKHAMKANTASVKYATMALIFGASKDDPEAVTNPGDTRGSVATFPKPASVKSNRPADPAPRSVGAAAAAQGAVEVSDGRFAVTVDVDKVWDGRSSAPGRPKGPGTVVAPDGVKYDTFDTGLLGIARGAKDEGKRVNIMYTRNEQYNKNMIVEHGLSVFGEVEGPEVDHDQEGIRGESDPF